MNTIKKIYDAAAKAESLFLDELIYLDRELQLFDFSEKDCNLQGFVDVPVKNIVALGRDDFWKGGDTWRDAVKRLHGEGWDEKVFEYFEGRIEEKEFPALGARRDLRLLCIGGACVCENGNHRLVAAKSWLAYRFGDEAVLKHVNVSYYPLEKGLRSLLVKARAKGAKVYISKIENFERWKYQTSGYQPLALIQLSTTPNIVYTWSNEGIDNIEIKRNLIERTFCLGKPSWFDERSKQLLPDSVINALLDDAWTNFLSNK